MCQKFSLQGLRILSLKVAGPKFQDSSSRGVLCPGSQILDLKSQVQGLKVLGLGSQGPGF